MGFLRCVGISTDSYVAAFLAVENDFPPEKILFWRELATGLTLSSYSYVGLISLAYPREGGRGKGRDPYVGIPIP
jgi:hypothetical protein